MLLTILITFTLLMVGWTKNSSESGCRKESFGSDSFVCVCDTKQCDYLGDPLTYQEGNPDVIVNLRPDRKKQKVFGFGGAFTDSAGINIRSLPRTLGDRIIAEYFCRDGGINYSFGRVPIGATDFSASLYSYDSDWNDFELKSFALAEEDYYYKIPFIRKAMECSPGLKLIGSLWTPPAWFLENERMFSGSYLKGKIGGLYYQLLAEYHVKFLNAYQKERLNFWGLTTSNEPIASTLFNFFLSFDADMLRDYIKLNLGPTLRRNGYGKENLKLFILDDPLISQFSEYVDTIMQDPAAAQYVSGFAFHWYAYDEGYERLEEIGDSYPKTFLLSTEACNMTIIDGLAVLGDWYSAEGYAHDIIQTLNRNSIGWIDWNLALNLRGGPNWRANYVNSPIIVDSKRERYYRQPMFYAMAHFSKFIEPGSVRISVETVKKDPSVELTAFIGVRGEMILVIVNKSSVFKKIDIRSVCKNKIQLKLLPRSIQTAICLEKLPL